MSEPSARIPTIDDLSHKQCYICLQSDSGGPSNPWVHPCKCTLIGHKSCLIASNQTACPQCRTPYVFLLSSYTIPRLIKLPKQISFCAGLGIAILSGSEVVLNVLNVLWQGLSLPATLLGLYRFYWLCGSEMVGLYVEDITAESIRDLIPGLLTMCLRSPVSGLSVGLLFGCWPRTPSLSARRRLFAYSQFPRKSIHASSTPSPTLVGTFFVPLTNVVYRLGITLADRWARGKDPFKRIRAAVIDDPPNNERNQEALLNLDEEDEDDGRGFMHHLRRRVFTFAFSNIVIPPLAYFIGEILAQSSHPAVREFLGVRPPLSELGLPGVPGLEDEAYWEWFLQWTWQEADAVWFRSTLGWGIVVVAKDFVKIVTTRMKWKESQTRHIKDHPFDKVDRNQLDLIRR